MAIALGTLTLPTVVSVLPAIVGGAGLSVILNNMGFKLPPLVTPTKTTASGVCPFEEAHEEVEALDGYTTEQKAEAHVFLNKAELVKKAHDAVTTAAFSLNV